MKYLNKYNNLSSYISAKQGDFALPHVSLIDDTKEVKYDPFIGDKLRFISTGASTLGLNKLGSHQTIDYSLDGRTWFPLTIQDTVNLNDGDMVFIRGKLTANNNFAGNDYTQFTMSGSLAAYGSINYLWNYENPNDSLKIDCGACLFKGCKKLTLAPELPATTLASGCYRQMFSSCGLLATPQLPATVLAEECYKQMFYFCEKMTTASSLPATSLATGCYSNMFQICSNLTSIPSLPATILTTDCYNNMFAGCVKITSSPVLAAQTLVERCYQQMFYGCKGLTTITMLATDISATNCLRAWTYSVTSETGTFYKDVNQSSLPEGEHGIPSGWTVINYSN